MKLYMSFNHARRGRKKKSTLIGLKINDKNRIDIESNLSGPNNYQYKLELEAYSYQNDLALSQKLFTKYCL